MLVQLICSSFSNFQILPPPSLRQGFLFHFPQYSFKVLLDAFKPLICSNHCLIHLVRKQVLYLGQQKDQLYLQLSLQHFQWHRLNEDLSSFLSTPQRPLPSYDAFQEPQLLHLGPNPNLNPHSQTQQQQQEQFRFIDDHCLSLIAVPGLKNHQSLHFSL